MGLFLFCGYLARSTEQLPQDLSLFRWGFEKANQAFLCLLPERYDVCVVLRCLYLRIIVCTDERGTFRRFEIAPKDEPDLISFDFPMMSSKEALS